MKTLLLWAVFSVCCALPASAASLDEVTPYFSSQYFTWEEHSDGRRILKERGPLFSGGILLGGITDFSLTLRGKAALFGGVVDYDGETQKPNPVPVRTDVAYFGTLQQFDVGYRFSSGNVRVEPFAALGYRWWLRDLHNATSVTGQPVSGYTEWWQVGYGRLGARGRYLMQSGVSVFAEGGATYPFYVANSVIFASSGTTTFRPVGELSGFAETGIAWSKLKLTLSYEGLRFSQSPVKFADNRYFLQPDSSSDIFGVSLGWAFR